MKTWQNGYDLDYLIEVAELYDEHHNKFAYSPFVEVNKRTVASLLGSNSLHIEEGLQYNLKTFKARSAIKCFDNLVTYKQAGDKEITKINYTNPLKLQRLLESYMSYAHPERVWIYIFEEDVIMKEVLRNLSYHKVCSQFKSTSEIIGIYTNLEPVYEKRVPDYDYVTLSRLGESGLYKDVAMRIAKKLEDFDTGFANHYSNFNKDKSWSALSIRGYSDDITFIEKPAEVMKSKKWADKYKDKEFELQYTKLYEYLKDDIDQLINQLFPNCEFDRIRLMQLTPGGGELERHSDLQDPDVGTEDGRTMRFHIPIVTNENVDFTAWDYDGNKITKNFKVGDLFYLDQRKPHTVVNNGETNRIHLVFDVIANEHSRQLISS